MLLEFTCSNFKSIKEKVSFSTIAGKDDQHKERLISFDKYDVLRSTVIYGANGSGKSNFLNAIAFVKVLVINSMSHQPGVGIFQAPHKLSDHNTPSEFALQFVRNGIRYAYGFSILQNAVKEEYLYYFPNKKKVKIFERDSLEISPGSKYRKSFDLAKTVLKENRLLLSCAANYSNIKEIEEAFLFFSEDIIIHNKDINNWIAYSMHMMQDDPQIKDLFVKTLHELNTGIKDIRIKIESVKIDLSELPNEMPQELKNMLASGETERIDTKVRYERFETDLMSEESEGIKKLFELIGPIIDIIKKGKILICDELENSLHESLVKKIIEVFEFSESKMNPQIIFSTHDTSLLCQDLFRRDQIWFTEMSPGERATNLYSLFELKNIRKSENLGKGYINGKYGAIPVMNPNFIEHFNQSITFEA